ncbi:PREDICTED: retinoic acid receptor responder protein 1 [Gekko japonicus]|uniref:Retinoic acid receptor responder protein 1 n=1 Tax=Gekko japonicus TaxID=146911 RepID=A0ABM1KMM4_GEKJA|nr:PREDICTED: retinoic acid receptor responder protein 1 [Gekko japonicus]
MMQPLKAPSCRGSRLLVLAALLVLSPAPGFVAQGARLLSARDSPLSRRGSLDSSSVPVQRAAQTAVNFFNYQQGSPSALRALGHVKKASLKLVPGVGRKYILQFTTKDLLTGENLGTCHSSVFYLKAKPKPAVEISCSPDQGKNDHQIQDLFLYLSLTEDKQPSLKVLRNLGVYGSSLVAWEMSTEDLAYTLTQVKDVKPWRRGDGAPEFDFTVLLGDRWGESSISCHVRVAWQPDLPVQVKYYCSPEDGSSESADGSGEELGSTDEFFLEAESNF